jgi:hypothetical protein
MGTVLPLQSGLIGQAKITLVNKCSRLKGARAILAVQPRPGKPQQVIVDDWSEPF